MGTFQLDIFWPIKTWVSQKSKKNRRREGSATLEFALLLPLFIVSVILVVECQEMMFRTMCNSHAAFTSARRWMVAGSMDEKYVRGHYANSGMRGTFVCTTNWTGLQPQTLEVTLRDRYTLLMPVGGDGALALKPETLDKLVVSEKTAGVVSRSYMAEIYKDKDIIPDNELP